MRRAQIQILALDRTRANQLLSTGHAFQQTHDYKRNGTETLFAAPDVLTGSSVSAHTFCQRHTNTGSVDFPGQVAAAPPVVELHVICNNYATHKHQNARYWLAANPQTTLHFTPTSCFWLNMVEILFGLSSANRSAADHSTGSTTSNRPSGPTSPTTTKAPNQSAGSKPQNTYWTRLSGSKQPTRATSCLLLLPVENPYCFFPPSHDLAGPAPLFHVKRERARTGRSGLETT
ncbi:hypothetical protein QFZ79_001187 [Arthrobacter sp. V4I6]|uniref:transposase n=1 Tax=unclassified Arthrobacter TaxID=235627 RepID=UPI00277D89D3|nr:MULTISPECIES: transposase [unclassified Arthrobacter]MDQ0823443.1 hypothetical protein [Arthrobacter sp. V1I7]MDQ0853076.1 hypothetical protein [Arthrobacter sp. V4I6]